MHVDLICMHMCMFFLYIPSVYLCVTSIFSSPIFTYCTCTSLYILVYLCISIIPCSVAVCQFTSRSADDWYVVVGTAKDLVLAPRQCSGGSLVVFHLSADGSKLEHVHTVSHTLIGRCSLLWLPFIFYRLLLMMCRLPWSPFKGGY